MPLMKELDNVRHDRSTVKYSFSGHETFPFRYTWLPKGVRHLKDKPELFVMEDALVVLGVGKNMVRSIRYWCEATGMIRRVDKKGIAEVSPLGYTLLGSDEGWDPYLEDPGTLWLLHWKLASNPSRSSTWHLAFTRWGGERFTKDQLVSWLGKLVADEQPRTQTTPASLQRDVEVFIRTYTPSKARRDLPTEDTFDCPLVELGLLQHEEDGSYQFVRGPKPTLPDEIFAYALMDYWKNSAPDQEVVSFENILHGPGSPGGVFQLSENALAERLENLPEWAGFRYDDTAGMRVMLRTERELDKETDPIHALEHYYEGNAAGARA